MLLKLAQNYAKLLNTQIIEGAFKEHEDGTITFVLVSGPKLSMNEVELRHAIAKLAVKPAASMIHTNEEAQKIVETLAPHHPDQISTNNPHSKKKEK